MSPSNQARLYTFLLVYCGLFAFFLPIETALWPGWRDFCQYQVAHLLNFLSFSANGNSVHSTFFSDSRDMYGFACLLIPVSFLFSLLITCIDRKNKIDKVSAFDQIFTWYLSLQLLRYGFSKLFFHQFYPVEPNLWIQPLADFSPDILYWSLAGASPVYQFTGGLLEVIGGILLLTPLFRPAARFLVVLLCAHVFFLNLSFNISVKVFSLFLLLIAVVLARKEIKALYGLFSGKKIQLPSFHQSPIRVMRFLNVLVPALILTETLTPYLFKAAVHDDEPMVFKVYSSQDQSVLSGDHLVFRSDGRYQQIRETRVLCQFGYSGSRDGHDFVFGSQSRFRKANLKTGDASDTLFLDHWMVIGKALKSRDVKLLNTPFRWTVEGMLEED